MKHAIFDGENIVRIAHKTSHGVARVKAIFYRPEHPNADSAGIVRQTIPVSVLRLKPLDNMARVMLEMEQQTTKPRYIDPMDAMKATALDMSPEAFARDKWRISADAEELPARIEAAKERAEKRGPLPKSARPKRKPARIAA